MGRCATHIGFWLPVATQIHQKRIPQRFENIQHQTSKPQAIRKPRLQKPSPRAGYDQMYLEEQFMMPSVCPSCGEPPLRGRDSVRAMWARRSAQRSDLALAPGWQQRMLIRHHKNLSAEPLHADTHTDALSVTELLPEHVCQSSATRRLPQCPDSDNQLSCRGLHCAGNCSQAKMRRAMLHVGSASVATAVERACRVLEPFSEPYSRGSVDATRSRTTPTTSACHPRETAAMRPLQSDRPGALMSDTGWHCTPLC